MWSTIGEVLAALAAATAVVTAVVAMVKWRLARRARNRQLKSGSVTASFKLKIKPPYAVAIPERLEQSDVDGLRRQGGSAYRFLLDEINGVIVGELPIEVRLTNTGPDRYS